MVKKTQLTGMPSGEPSNRPKRTRKSVSYSYDANKNEKGKERRLPSDEEGGSGYEEDHVKAPDDDFEYLDDGDDSQDEYRPSPPPSTRLNNATRRGEYSAYQNYNENNMFANNDEEVEGEVQSEMFDLAEGYDQYQEYGEDADLNMLERWKQVGNERRRKQAEKALEEQGQEGEVELEEDRFQEMANALADVSKSGSMNNVVERWGQTLRADEDLEEEMDDVAFEQDLRGATGFRQKRVRGDGDGGRRARRIAPRQQAVSPQAKTLLAQANMAYAMNDISETMVKLQEVIRIEPTVRSAWGTLALCHQSLGDYDNELLCRVMEAQLTSNPLNVWLELASKCQDRGSAPGLLFCLQHAILSSREKDRSDVRDLMWERAEILYKMGEYKPAAKQFLRILDFQPQNEEVIRTVVPLLHGMDLKERAVMVMQRCAEWNMKAFPDPNNIVSPVEDYENVTYNSDAIATVADLLLELGRPQDAIDAIRRGTRWLQGRHAETFWDDIQDDDREFDENRSQIKRQGEYTRRINLAPEYELDIEFRFRLAVARARLGDVKECRYHFDVFRTKVDVYENIDHWTTMVDECIQLASSLDEEESAETKTQRTHLFAIAQKDVQIINECRRDLYDRAEVTIGDEEEMEEMEKQREQLIEDYKRLAACCMGNGNILEASQYLELVLQASPDDLESKLRLAEALEEVEPDRAIQLVGEVIRQRRIEAGQAMQEEQEAAAAMAERAMEGEEEDDTVTQSLSIFAEAKKPQKSRSADKENQKKQSLQIEALRERETVKSYEKVKSLESRVFIARWWHNDVPFNGDPNERIYGYHEDPIKREERFNHVSEWVAEMESLITMFLETRQLFPRDKLKIFKGMFRSQRRKTDRLDREAHALLDRMRDQLMVEDSFHQNVEQTKFRGIELDEWVDLVMQYAFVLTKINQFNMAKKILRRFVTSNVIWSSDQRRMSLRLCSTSCALYAGRIHSMFKDSSLRFVPFLYQFHTEALRTMLVISNSTGFAGHEALHSPNNIKFFLRRSRTHEAIVQGAKCSFNKSNRRWIIHDSMFDHTLDETVNRDLEGEEKENNDEEEEEENEEDNQFRGQLDEEKGQEDNSGEYMANKNRDKSSDVNATINEMWNKLKGIRELDVAKHKPPTRYNPANELFYAGLLLTSSNGIPSMAYCLRVYTRFPDDPLVCLANAVACLGRASNRQVDNRNQTVMQAFAFLHKYRALRRKDDEQEKEKEGKNVFEAEIQYNFARVAHQLGLYQMAVPHYNAVLRDYKGKDHDDVETIKYDEPMQLDDHQDIDPALLGKTNFSSVQRSIFDCTAESAFGLHLVYLASGNPSLANAIVERYLRI